MSIVLLATWRRIPGSALSSVPAASNSFLDQMWHCDQFDSAIVAPKQRSQCTKYARYFDFIQPGAQLPGTSTHYRTLFFQLNRIDAIILESVIGANDDRFAKHVIPRPRIESTGQGYTLRFDDENENYDCFPHELMFSRVGKIVHNLQLSNL